MALREKAETGVAELPHIRTPLLAFYLTDRIAFLSPDLFMIPVTPHNLIPPLVSFALALALTPVVRVLARRWGFIAKPKTDRWHKKPTAMMGGVGDLAGGSHHDYHSGSAHPGRLGDYRRGIVSFRRRIR